MDLVRPVWGVFRRERATGRSDRQAGARRPHAGPGRSGPRERHIGTSRPATPVSSTSVSRPHQSRADGSSRARPALAVSDDDLPDAGAERPGRGGRQNADAPALICPQSPGERSCVAVAGTRVVVADRMVGADVLDVRPDGRSRSAPTTDGYTRDVAIAGSLVHHRQQQ